MSTITEDQALALVEEYGLAVSKRDRLHAEHMGKAMTDQTYNTFATLRDDTIPALRKRLVSALAATGTPQVPSDEQIEDLGVQFGCAVDVGVLSGNRTITWYGGESFGARHMEFARALVTLASQGAAPASECDSPKLCAVNKGCAGQYGTKRVCSTPAPGAAPTGGDAPAGASTTGLAENGGAA